MYRHRQIILTVLCIAMLSSAHVNAENRLENQPGFKIAAKQVLSVMNKWARAWAQLDARTYISSYSPDYIGKGFPSHFTWAASRQHRLENQKNIKLSFADVEILSTKKGLFTVKFTQRYESNNYQDTTRKQLDFKLVKGDWYIVAEKSFPKLKKTK